MLSSCCPPVTWQAAGPTEGSQPALDGRLICTDMRLGRCNPSLIGGRQLGSSVWPRRASDHPQSLALLQRRSPAGLGMLGQGPEPQSKEAEAILKHWQGVCSCFFCSSFHNSLPRRVKSLSPSHMTFLLHYPSQGFRLNTRWDTAGCKSPGKLKNVHTQPHFPSLSELVREL